MIVGIGLDWNKYGLYGEGESFPFTLGLALIIGGTALTGLSYFLLKVSREKERTPEEFQKNEGIFKLCIRCREKIAEDALFCPKCGTRQLAG